MSCKSLLCTVALDSLNLPARRATTIQAARGRKSSVLRGVFLVVLRAPRHCIVAARLAGKLREWSATVQRSEVQVMNPLAKLEIVAERTTLSLGS